MMRCSLVPCSEATSGKRYCFLPKKTNDGHRALKKIAVRLNFHNQNEGTRRRGPVWTCWAIDSLNDVSLFPENLDPIVRQVMNRDVIFLKETQTIRDAIQMFLSSGISGAPVLDGHRRLIGVLSETDIIKKEAGVVDALKRASWANNNLNIEQLPADLKKKPKTKLLLDTLIKDVMTTDPISISPEISIVQAAILMIKSEVNRFPVVENDRVIGILTRGDILQCMIWEILIAGSTGAEDEP